MRLTDTAIGLLLLACGIALALAAWSYPDMPGQDYGAATFPLAIGALVAALGLVSAWSGLRNGEDGASRVLRLHGWGLVPASWLRLAAVVLLVVGYVLLAPLFGFLLTGGALLFGLLTAFRAPLLLSVVVTPPAILAVWWVFDGLLRVPLPNAAILTGGA